MWIDLENISQHILIHLFDLILAEFEKTKNWKFILCIIDL